MFCHSAFYPQFKHTQTHTYIHYIHTHTHKHKHKHNHYNTHAAAAQLIDLSSETVHTLRLLLANVRSLLNRNEAVITPALQLKHLHEIQRLELLRATLSLSFSLCVCFCVCVYECMCV